MDNYAVDYNYGYTSNKEAIKLDLHPDATIYYYKTKDGKVIGSLNAYKISKMASREWEIEITYKMVAKTNYLDFLKNLNGELHNEEWLG